MSSHVIHGPGELIATIPLLLGYAPEESVVLVGIDARGGVALLVRVHRDELLLGQPTAAAAHAVADQARRAQVRHAFLVSYTTTEIAWGCEAADMVADALAAVAIDADAWACDGDRYWSPGCADAACCPPGGTDVPPAANVPEHLVAEDPCSRLERLYGRPCVKAPADVRRRASQAGDRWWARRARGLDAWRVESLDRLLPQVRGAATVLDLGRAAVTLRDVRVRDGLIVAWLRGGRGAIADTLAGRATDDVARVLDGALHDVGHQPPSHGEVEEAVAWCRAVAGVARQRDCAAAHALEAVVLWWSGDASAAATASDTALGCDPAHSLARLVAGVCDGGLLPAWTRA